MDRTGFVIDTFAPLAGPLAFTSAEGGKSGVASDFGNP